MSKPSDVLTVRLVFDRSLNPSVDIEHDTVGHLQRILSQLAPRWCSDVTTWDSNPKNRIPVDFSLIRSLAEVISAGTETVLGFNSGSIELRGATEDFVVVVTINDRPLRPVGGRLLMPNGVTIQITGETVEGRASTDFAYSLFDVLCSGEAPLWGATHYKSEYTSKVMQTTPTLRAVGRDFSRYLPGLFAVNYFDNRYVKILGHERFAATEGCEPTRSGVILLVANPKDWQTRPERYESVLRTLGSDLFFDIANPNAPKLAPRWS
jgi:hypothetical protein